MDGRSVPITTRSAFVIRTDEHVHSAKKTGSPNKQGKQANKPEIYVKPIENYLSELPQSVRFGDLMHLANGRDGEICIGVKLGALSTDSSENFGVRMIPDKRQQLQLRAGDALVVVAEDDR